MTEPCYECDAEAELVRGTRQVRVGDRTVTVEAEYMACSGCGETFFLPGQMREMQRAAASVVRKDDGLLPPEEIVAIRERYGLTQAGLEKLINAGPKTVTRWERGAVAQNGTADTLLRVLRDHSAVARQLAAARGVPIALPTGGRGPRVPDESDLPEYLPTARTA